MILLLQLGYKIGTMVRFLFTVLLTYIVSVAVVSFGVYMLLYTLLTSYMQNRQLESGNVITTETLVVLPVLCGMLLLTGLWSISSRVKKYA